MLFKLHKYSSWFGAFFWLALGMLTIGSIAASSIGWGINLGMGLLFMVIGYFVYSRANLFHRFHVGAADNVQKNPHLERFIRLDFLFSLGICFVGALLLMAAVSRVFGEGFAVFG